MAKKTVTTAGRQTSSKAGVQSLAKKMDNSRHGFETQPAARKVAGASGRKTAARAPGTASRRPGKGSALGKLKG